jgi:hypothetical protein
VLKRTLLVVWALVIVAVPSLRGIEAAGDELVPGDGAYGWVAAKDVGAVFTDGLNHVTIGARGPLRLISARPLMDGGPTLRGIGVLARIVPDMLPPGHRIGGFQQMAGFPPARPDAAGAIPVEGLVVPPSSPGQPRWIELQIGYAVVAPGRSARRGVELIYEYQHTTRRVIVPSYLAICAPSGVACPPEYD